MDGEDFIKLFYKELEKKIIRFNRVFKTGIRKSSINLKEFRVLYRNNLEFRTELICLSSLYLDKTFNREVKEVFYKELELVFQKYKNRLEED